MKYYFLLVSLFVTSMAMAAGQTEAPYTLVGGPQQCDLTVHEYGYENVDGTHVFKPRPKKFYADVTVSDAPDVVFHLKATYGRYVAYDGNSGYRLVVSGASIMEPTPMNRGIYMLYNGRKLKARCSKLILQP